MMRIPIDPNSHEPIYAQILVWFRQRILSREFPEDMPLPSMRQLAIDLKINMLTVNRAYQELKDDGLIYNRRGEGTFVAKVSESESLAMRQTEIRQMLAQVFQKAELLGLNRDEISEILKDHLTSLKDP